MSDDQLKNQMQDALEEAYRYLHQQCFPVHYGRGFRCTECGDNGDTKLDIRHSETCVFRIVREALIQAYREEGEADNE